eukprot:9637608-Prorocentrum_lima.AAC.1
MLSARIGGRGLLGGLRRGLTRSGGSRVCCRGVSDRASRRGRRRMWWRASCASCSRSSGRCHPQLGRLADRHF